jgi:hypothetical protein
MSSFAFCLSLFVVFVQCVSIKLNSVAVAAQRDSDDSDANVGVAASHLQNSSVGVSKIPFTLDRVQVINRLCYTLSCHGAAIMKWDCVWCQTVRSTKTIHTIIFSNLF